MQGAIFRGRCVTPWLPLCSSLWREIIPRRATMRALAGILSFCCLLWDATANAEWEICFVDGPAMTGHMSERSLRLDASDRPHLVYGQFVLRYARHNGTSWCLETVPGTAGAGGEQASLVLDSQECPHVTYYDKAEKRLMYAWRGENGWHAECVDEEGDVGSYSSLALDASDHPRVAYYAGPPYGDLRYAVRDEAGWRTEIVDALTNCGRYASLCLDEAGQPHVAYQEASRHDVKYAVRDEIGWRTEAFGSGNDVSLALDDGGSAYVAFQELTGRGLAYAVRDSVGWHVEIVDTPGVAPGVVGAHPSLKLDEVGRPHISYFDESNLDLKHAWNLGAGWQIEVVAAEGSVGEFNSLALSNQGEPCIAYYDQSEVTVRYAVGNEPGWNITPVETSRVVGYYPDLALDTAGFPHVSYYDSTFGDLMHAYEDAAGWHREPVDRRGDTGQWTSIEVDSQGRVDIAYAGYYSGEHLRYAAKDDCGWQIETIHEDITPTRISLELDGDDQPHVAFRSWTIRPNCYAYRTGGTWQIEPFMQEYSTVCHSLALDDWGYPHVSVGRVTYDGGCLMYAFHDGFAWHSETLGQNTVSGSSLRLGVDGYPRIVVTEQWGWGPLFACRDPSGWHTSQIDMVPSGEGQNCSLTLDGADRPHAAYYDSRDGDLRYAWHDGGAWHIEVVDQGFDVGAWPSIRLMPDGTPCIAYFDRTSRAVKFARGRPSVANDDEPQSGPKPALRLLQVYPNPATNCTKVTFAADAPGVIDLALFDLAGRRVQTLAQGPHSVGAHALTWSVSGIPAGHYLVRLVVNADAASSAPVIVVRP